MSKPMPKPGTVFDVPGEGKWIAVKRDSGEGCRGCEVPQVSRSKRDACGKFPDCCELFVDKSVVFKRYREVTYASHERG